MKIEKHEVVVVGGGLVGALLATLLVQRGHRVVVFEQRPDLRAGPLDGGRSINLVVTRRGIRALELVGLAEGALALTVPVTGRMMHAVDGTLTFQPYGRDASECNYSISRAGLNLFLVHAAADQGVRFRFETRLIGADLARNRLRFEGPGAERVEVQAGVVFGADGAGSALREAFKQQPDFEESVAMLDHGYKELSIPAGPGGAFRIEKNALHIWPRGELMLMALPNLDGSFTVTLYLPYAGRYGFDRLTAEATVLELFERQFPDAIPLLPDLVESFAANPTGSLGTVRCAPWQVAGRAALIGDAAHGIVPFFGQGMNTGFEDCTVLAELMARHDGWATVLTEWERTRKRDADAIADMALENFVEMREHVGDRRFLLRKQIEHLLERAMSTEYRSRYSMVMYSHIPFSVAYGAGRIQQGILEDLCPDSLQRADDVDLRVARRLIDERLTPYLRQHGVRLDY